MNKSDLIVALSKKTGLICNKAEEVVTTVLNSMANTIAAMGWRSFKIY
jgi:nucleoid DNA-binding protein